MGRFTSVLLASALAVSIVSSAQLKPAATGTAPASVVANDNRTPAGTLASGVLTLHLEVRAGVWHPEAPDSRPIQAYFFGEEGRGLQTPGPLIRVPQGTELQVSVRNQLPVAVTIHGLQQHPGKAEDAMKLAPGEVKEAKFTAGEPGSYIYSASTSTERGRPVGSDGTMAGGFIVDGPDALADRVFVIQLWEHDLYTPKFDGELTINGKSWPYTERLDARLGQPERWRILNATPLEHPMHMHGFYFFVDATGDGEAAHRLAPAERRMVVTESLPPGHTFDMSWTPERTGNWIFHCHILDHMSNYLAPWLFGPGGPPAMPVADSAHMQHDDGSMGMAGLVLGIHVTDPNPVKEAKAVIPPVAAERHLFVRERPASAYVPAGPGFYLEGVSQQVGAVGPPLVVTRGERTAVAVTNELDSPTAIHWHGIEIESYYDGVAGWAGSARRTTPPIAPHSTFVAYMTPPRAGTFIYHTHWHDVQQLTGGLYGALLVLEPGQKYDPTTDKVFLLGRSGANELRDPLMLNGSPQPRLMVLLAGQTYRFRFINITPVDSETAMSLTLNGHPVQWRAIAKDGADLPAQQATVREATQPISVGETYDFEFAPKEDGDYELRFCSPLGSVVTQVIAVVPRESRFSVFAAKH